MDANNVLDKYRAAFSDKLPKSELEAKLFSYYQDAKRTYDKSSGASFSTHLHNRLQRLHRDVHESTTTLKSSESLGLSVNKIKRAVDEFYMTHGREPTVEEISKATSISPKIVEKHMGVSKIKPVHVEDFATPAFGETVSIQELLPSLDEKSKKVAETIDKGMDTKDALKHTGMQQASYYRALSRLREKARQAYLRKTT